MKTHYCPNYLLNPVHPVTINLIGLGGTGSQVLSNLARIHTSLVSLGHPGLLVRAFDPDQITDANLGRQLFSPTDLYQNKATVLVNRINRFFGLDWEAYSEKFYGQKLSNITISCIDTFSGRMELAELLKSFKGSEPYEKMYYWIDFGNSHQTGQVIIGTVSKVSQPKSNLETKAHLICFDDWYNQTFGKHDPPPDDDTPSCSLAQALGKQDLFINSTLAMFGSDLIWKLISTGSIKSQGVFLNLQTLKTTPIWIN